jgi:hypothetical protein
MFRGMNASTALTTESIWRDRVRQWRESGETADQFAKGRGFAASTLRYWSRRLGRTEQAHFVRLVPRAPARAPGPDLVIEVGCARVRVAPGFDATLLTEVVRVLGGVSR